MKRVELTFRRRLLLSDLVGSQRGTIEDGLLLGGILKKLQFAPAESKALGLKVELRDDKPMFVWDPAADLSKFGKTVELEEEEARRLKTLIGTHTAWTIPDAEEMNRVRQQLDGTAPANPARKERKGGSDNPVN